MSLSLATRFEKKDTQIVFGSDRDREFENRHATFLTTMLLCDEAIAGIELGPITVYLTVMSHLPLKWTYLALRPFLLSM